MNNQNKKNRMPLGLILLLLLIEFAQADALEEKINKIAGYLSGTAMKSIGSLIVAAVCIYLWKNLDRWKEVGLTCLGIILGALGIVNSQAIANWALS